MMERLFGPLFALAVLAPAAHAQVRADTARLGELVVTSTRLPTSPNAVTGSVTTIRGEALEERGIHFVADALREIPSAMVVPGGSFGGVTALFLRGGESDYVKVLVDGVPVNQAGGAFNFAHLTTDNVDRIEIVRGPGSVLYGSDAVTGIIQVFTRQGRGPLAVHGDIRAGSFGTTDWAVGASGGGERAGGSVEVSRFTTDGVYDFNNAYRNTAASSRLRLAPDARSRVDLAVRYGDSRYHFPTDASGVPSDRNQFTTEETLTLSLEGSRWLGSRVEARAGLTAGATESGSDDRPDTPADTLDFFASRRSADARRRSADARVNVYASPWLIVTAGTSVEYEREEQRGESSFNFGGGPTTVADAPADHNRTTVGYYAQGLVDLPSGLALNLNARVDDNSAFGSFATYRAGVAYRFRAGTRLRASIGRGFKAPTFCEQFCTGFATGNPELEPERASSWEAGIEQALPGGRVSVFATYFDQRFRDLILYTGAAAPGDPNYINGAAARSRGLEVGGSVGLGADLSAVLSYTYLDAAATDDAGQPSATFAAGEPLIRRPAHSAHAGLRYRLRSVASISADVNYIGTRGDVDFNSFPAAAVELPAVATLDLAASVDVLRAAAGRPGLTLTGRAENLLDERYETTVGFPARGRTVFAGARVRL